MARRKSSVANFLEGFNAGWDTVGKVGAAYNINKLDDDEERLKVDGGLAANDDGKYTVFGQTFDEKPTDFQISAARNTAQADIYDRFGMKDDARGLRKDALASKLQGQQFRTSEQAYNQSEQLFPGQLEAQGLTNRQSQQAIDQADKMNPLILELQQLNIDGKGASNRAQELANTLSQMTITQRNITDPLAVDQARATLNNTKRVGIGQDLANQYSRETMDDRTGMAAAQRRAAETGAELGELTLDANVARTIADSQYAVNTLNPKVRAAIANADAAELNTLYAEQTFDNRRESLSTSLKLSQAQLDQTLEENPHRLQGLIDSNILTGLNIDAKTLDNDQRAQIDGINQSYYDALVKGDFTGVETNLMPFAAQVYNDTNVADDDNKAVQNEDGSFSIVGPDGNVIGSASDMLKALPMSEKRDVIRQAQAYAVASITGDYGAINELYKTDAWISYYQAKAQTPSLTKAQWAIQRFNNNPMDKLAIAILAGDQAEEVFSQQLDPTYQLQNRGDGNNEGGQRPPDIGNGGNSTVPEEVAPTNGKVLVDAMQSSGGLGPSVSVTDFVTKMNEEPRKAGNRNYGAEVRKRAAMSELLQNPQAISEAISEVGKQLTVALENRQTSGNRARVKNLKKLFAELQAYQSSLNPTEIP